MGLLFQKMAKKVAKHKLMIIKSCLVNTVLMERKHINRKSYEYDGGAVQPKINRQNPSSKNLPEKG